jgi:hypothetical protein
MPKTFTLSVEPVIGAVYRHPYHLGTDEAVARRVAEYLFERCEARDGGRMRTVALKHDGHIVDVLDRAGWNSVSIWALINDPLPPVPYAD